MRPCYSRWQARVQPESDFIGVTYDVAASCHACSVTYDVQRYDVQQP